MAEAIVTILGQTLRLACADGDVRRVEDLARTLDLRLKALTAGGDCDAVRGLSLVSLALVAESQAARAALARAHAEIDRLHDILVTEAPPRPVLRIVGRA